MRQVRIFILKDGWIFLGYVPDRLPHKACTVSWLVHAWQSLIAVAA